MPSHTPGVVSWAAGVAVGFVRSSVLVGASMLMPAIWAALALVCFFWRANPWSWIAPIIIACALVMVLARPIGRLFRALVARWTGVVVADGYRDAGAVTQLSTGHWWNGHEYARSRRRAQEDLQLRLRFTDPAGWRDRRWLAIAAVTVGPVAAVPLAGVAGAVVAFTRASAVSIAAGVVLLAIGIVTAPYAWRIVGPTARRWLQPPASALADAALSERVRELTAQRADATSAQAAEIRRIERDLHDGAQARLVALGLSLATAEKLMATDPDAAVTLLGEARAGVSTSLTELRELVRGINPPVLSERGLTDAIRALALDSPLAVDVHSDLQTRPDAPIESALYFATSELLTNAVKHADASLAVVRIHRNPAGITVDVEDDGHGGAIAAEDGGLAGVRRRLAVFDGTIGVSSPVGGPTRVTMVVPCELS